MKTYYIKKLNYYVKFGYYGFNNDYEKKTIYIESEFEFTDYLEAEDFYLHIVSETERLMDLMKMKYKPYEKIELYRGRRLIKTWERKLVGYYFSKNL